MLGRIIDAALKQRLLVFLGALALAVWGANAFLRLPIDAFPDVAPVQVLVAMRAPGLTPEELESRVTAPIEIAMRGIPNLAAMRSTTRYSVALITLEFTEGTDIFWARAQVNERMQDVRDQLPVSTDGGLAPIVTALGEMLMFTIESETLNAQQMRQLVDWTIRPALRGCRALPISTCWVDSSARSRSLLPPRRWRRAGLRPSSWKTPSPPTTATTGPAGCATARRRCWCARRDVSATSKTCAISWSPPVAARPSGSPT